MAGKRLRCEMVDAGCQLHLCNIIECSGPLFEAAVCPLNSILTSSANPYRCQGRKRIRKRCETRLKSWYVARAQFVEERSSGVDSWR